ncbi:hypothetical protein [Streptomyces sp. LS1784]|uniref:hypothetical protein n=1 Tax=Streptomyces sp. LS1784 TaxID=2851533 RepID=UPI001CCD87DF|nr:hypothetical protein [Streptomyces sp. LS1784]
MIIEEFREEHRAWSPTPQLPKLAPPVDRTRRTGGALGDSPGVEADKFDWSKIITGGLDALGGFL